MKYLFAVFVLAGLLLVGCGDQKTEQKPVEEKDKFAFDSTDIKTTVADNPNETFQLRYKFETGKKYNYRLTTISKDNSVIKADTTINQDISQNIIYLFTITGKEVDQEGVAEVECNFTSIRLDAQAGGQSFSYESGKADSADKVKFSEYEALLNSPFSVRVSKLGEIVEIFRVDKIMNKYLKIKGYADSVTAEEKNMLRRDLAEGAIRPIMIQVFRDVPEKTLAKDSTWQKVQPESQFMIFKMQNTSRYEIENLEMLDNDKIAVLDAGLTTNISGNMNFSDRGADYSFEKPKTHAEGKIFFNITDGLVQKSRVKTVIDLFYTMEAPTPQGRQKGSKKEVIENVNILERL